MQYCLWNKKEISMHYFHFKTTNVLYTIVGKILALTKQTKAISTRSAAQGTLQYFRQRINIGGKYIISISSFLAAGYACVVATPPISSGLQHVQLVGICGGVPVKTE